MRTATRLDEFLETGDTEGAVELLKRVLTESLVVAPANDKTWADAANRIGASITSSQGVAAGVAYWQDLTQFFTNELEPSWGRLHKGHLYFHEGLTEARRSLNAAKQAFEAAYAEDRETETLRGGTEAEVERRLQNYSAHVALAMLERISDETLVEPRDRATFWAELFGPSFDAVLHGVAVDPRQVSGALEHLAVAQLREVVLERYEDLHAAALQQRAFSIVAAAGIALEAILLGQLHYCHGVAEVRVRGKDKDIFGVELGPLLAEARNRQLFGSPSIDASFTMIHAFRNRLHPGNEAKQTYRLTPRVSASLKALFDLALVRWAQA